MTKPVPPPNIHPHDFTVTRQAREKARGHKGVTVWFTGPSGSGKSSVANLVEVELHERGLATHVLDGDSVRSGLSGDLGFSDADKTENIRRVGEVAKMFTDAGILTLAAFVSPSLSARQQVRETLGKGDFIEVYVKTPVGTFDREGLTKGAIEGEVENLPGVNAEYQPPENAELVLENGEGVSLETLAAEVVTYLEAKGYLGAENSCEP